MSLFSQAMSMCHDCDSSAEPLAWSRDGNTKICASCREKRGDREIGERSERSLESEALEYSLRDPQP